MNLNIFFHKCLVFISDFIIDFTKNDFNKIKFNEYQDSNKEKAFSTIIRFLNNSQVDYFLSGGTLLGIYRDGKLIDWDDDIDIDIFSSSYRINIKKIIEFVELNNFPYELGSNYFHPKISICISNVKVSLVALSRGIFKRNYFYRSKYRVPYSICKPTKIIKSIDNMELLLPNKTEDYLIFLYGLDWEKPIKWEKEDNNENYNNRYIRRGKRYMLLDHLQLLFSKLIVYNQLSLFLRRLFR